MGGCSGGGAAMRVKVEQIVWHERLPVLSCDIRPAESTSGAGGARRGSGAITLATAGGDRVVNLWTVSPPPPPAAEEGDGEGARQAAGAGNGAATAGGVQHQQALTYHHKTVNVVRFSPDGSMLVSGGDGGELFVWHLASVPGGGKQWRTRHVLRGHTAGGDIFDAAWSPDSAYIISGSVDNVAIVWNVATGKVVHQFCDHSHYVQGVAWDPLGRYAITQSADRSFRVYGKVAAEKGGKPPKGKVATGPFYLKHIVSKWEAPTKAPVPTPTKEAVGGEGSGKDTGDGKGAGAGGGEAPKQNRHALFHDESSGSFFRRLAWAPDGSFVVTPAGMHRSGAKGLTSTAYVFKRSSLSSPVAHLPTTKPAIAARFCRSAFAHDASAQEEATKGLFALPYRLLLAVASVDSVVVYDTGKPEPIAVIGGIHLAPLSDLSWSSDGRCLAISSQDGYCSFVWLDDEEVGERAELDLPKVTTQLMAADTAMLAAAPGPSAGDGSEPPAAVTLATGATGAAPRRLVPQQVQPDAPAGGPRRIVPQQVQPDSAKAGGAHPGPKRRIVPQEVGAGPCAPTATGGGAATDENGQPPKQKRRIVPMAVAGPAPTGFS